MSAEHTNTIFDIHHKSGQSYRTLCLTDYPAPLILRDIVTPPNEASSSASSGASIPVLQATVIPSYRNSSRYRTRFVREQGVVVDAVAVGDTRLRLRAQSTGLRKGH